MTKILVEMLVKKKKKRQNNQKPHHKKTKAYQASLNSQWS